MSDLFKEFDPLVALLWLVPGASISMFRSLGLKGSFPSIGKDDLAALLLGSLVYYFVAVILVMDEPLGRDPALLSLPKWKWLFVLIVAPTALGLGLGMLEAGDYLGKALRRVGFPLPSPTPTAWETTFRELPQGAVLLITLKDGALVVGRWIDDGHGSSASIDPRMTDLFMGEIGEIDAQGSYVPKTPRRSLYISAGEIRFFEVIIP